MIRKKHPDEPKNLCGGFQSLIVSHAETHAAAWGFPFLRGPTTLIISVPSYSYWYLIAFGPMSQEDGHLLFAWFQDFTYYASVEFRCVVDLERSEVLPPFLQQERPKLQPLLKALIHERKTELMFGVLEVFREDGRILEVLMQKVLQFPFKEVI